VLTERRASSMRSRTMRLPHRAKMSLGSGSRGGWQVLRMFGFLGQGPDFFPVTGTQSIAGDAACGLERWAILSWHLTRHDPLLDSLVALGPCCPRRCSQAADDLNRLNDVGVLVHDNRFYARKTSITRNSGIDR